ncbi:MAG: transcription initiation factor IIB [Candidatus Bathyarchaeota archaeon]|nr:MAG: transcription initiation factor IIB [Candidatus Bathyarchaeota archaeon]
MNFVSSEKCIECGTSLLIRDPETGEVVCGKCGVVISTQVADLGPEWRAYTPEEQKQKIRVGSPETLCIHDKGLSTKIDWRDITGFKPEKRAQLKRISQWQQRSRISNSSERSISLALIEIRRVSDKLRLPKNIIETASVIYRKAVNKKLIRGRTIRGMAAASTYLACRQNKLIRSISKISNVSGIKRKEISSNYRYLVKELKIFVPIVRPNQHITKLSNSLELNGVTEGIAHKILIGAKKQKLTSGRGAKSIAAAACYIASRIVGNYRTQREVADAAELTEVTIRNRYKEMLKRLTITVNL